jgi:hypothetical protein
MKGPYAVVYAGDPLNPDNFETNFAAVREANWHTIYLKFLHVSNSTSDLKPVGSLYFNGDPFISQGKVLHEEGHQNFTFWNETLLNLKKYGGVQKIYLSIGGGSGSKPDEQVIDFQTIYGIYQDNGFSFKGSQLETNLKALRDSFQSVSGTPLIDGIDMDIEDHYEYQDSFIALCELVSELNWQISVAPCDNSKLTPFWIPVLQALKGKVQRINLQSNAPNASDWVTQFGDSGIHIDDWILGDLATYWTGSGWLGDCPDQVTAFLQERRLKVESNVVTGGFIYDMDWIVGAPTSFGAPCGNVFPTMKMYADAILAGMADKVVASR